MHKLIGALRFAFTLLVLFVTAVLVLMASVLPIQFRGASLAAWLTTLACRLAMWVYNVRLRCDNVPALRQHTGLLFANHISYFDILALQSIFPFRFLSAIENKKIPLVGLVARAIGTVFVNRSEKSSRQEARAQVAAAPKFPALVLYPEGGFGELDHLNPFRYGAFEIAIEGNTPILPCVLVYDNRALIRWNWKAGESMWQSMWRMMCHNKPIGLTLTVLPVVQPQAGDQAPDMATHLHRAMSRVLGFEAKM